MAEFRQPTPARPLRVLVTGDSQAEFVGQRLVDVAPPGLIRTDVVARNSTGLTRPDFFNWEVNARQEVAARKPDAVVMLMGGNDGFNVDGGRRGLRAAHARVGDRVRAPDGGGDAGARLARQAARVLGARPRPRATRS